jgi:segregation and condensation protein B
MSEIKSKIASLLFIAAKPLSNKQLAQLIQVKDSDIQTATAELINDYKNNNFGVRIVEDGDKYQMVSAPESAKVVQEFIKDETTGELTRPSLEALTIIAYRGPIAKMDLDRIRGVNCALILRNLLLRGLIEAKFDKKKNDTYYTVTIDFIRFLGASKVEELPDYERLHQDDTLEKMLEPTKEAV